MLNLRSSSLIVRQYAKRQQWRSSLPSTRSYTLDSFSGGGGGGDRATMAEVNNWPITKPNTILNIVPQGKMYVVERFGKLHEIQPSGFFLAVPLVDEIAYIIDTRERAIDIPPQSAITRDNVTVDVSGNLFLAFVDPERAAYGARNPLYAVMQVSILQVPTFTLCYTNCGIYLFCCNFLRKTRSMPNQQCDQP